MQQNPEQFRETPKKIEISPTTQNILDGKATITFLKSDTETRNVAGHQYTGVYYMYELEVPKPNGDVWKTHLTTWSPIKNSEKNYVSLPKMQITINTGQGEIPISNNPTINDGIYREIERQMSTKK